MRRLTPIAIAGGHRFVQLTGGNGFVCGLTADGRVFCWGDFLDRSDNAPVLSSGTVTFRHIDAGERERIVGSTH